MNPPLPEVLQATLAHINDLVMLAKHDGFREIRGDETLEHYQTALSQYIAQTLD